jgi:hypothetical protein
VAVTGSIGGVLKLDAAGDTIPDRMFVKHIRWFNATTAGHQLLVKNYLQSEELFPSIADGQYFLDVMPLYRWVDGLNIVTMQSGYILVYTG